MEKKGKYTIAALLPGFFRKKGKGILPLHNGGKRNLRVTVLVKVKKGKTYTLGIQPFTEKSGDDGEELKLALDTKKYSKSYDSLQDPA